jgi:cytochrome b subunit of formate dehydrogenase
VGTIGACLHQPTFILTNYILGTKGKESTNITMKRRAVMCEHKWLRLFAILTISLLLSSFSIATSSAIENDECYSCHGDSGILKMSKEELEGMVTPLTPKKVEVKYKKQLGGLSLSINPEIYKSSIHGSLSCTDCHTDILELPHAQILKAVECKKCHEEAAKAYENDLHYLSLKKGVADAPLCQDCHGTHDIFSKDNNKSAVYPINQGKTCARCHENREIVKKYGITIPHPYSTYEKSAHAKAIAKGKTESATCSSCHGYHTIKPSSDPKSPTNKVNEPLTCATCHLEMYEMYSKSIHGRAVMNGNVDSPVCSDCHNEHNIQSKTEPSSTIYPTAVKTTCNRCHGSEMINQRYGMSSSKVKSYEDSYHGLIDKYGSTTTANCASCHGSHNILPSTDPRSSTHPANLAKTCATCHPGVGPNFAKGKVHLDAVTLNTVKEVTFEEKIYFIIKITYIILIISVIGGMIIHQSLDYFAKLRVLYKRLRAQNRPYVRLNLDERIQHIVLMVSFTVLALSGFCLSFHWAPPFIDGTQWEAIRRIIHRVAAVTFILLSLYHLYYITFTSRGREIFKAFMPVSQDIWDVIQQFKFYLGLTNERPKFGKYNYVEKAEYLALVWGTVIMISTGAIMWFKTEATAFLPKWSLDVADLIHFMEALLASLAIIVWHFYYVIINPDISPMNLTWLIGGLTEEEMEHEHPLELEEIKEEEADRKIFDNEESKKDFKS